MGNENEVSRKLETMIPMDVYKRLLAFAQDNTSTAFGKWDFGVAIKILLDRSDMMVSLDNLNERVEIMELELNKLKAQKREGSVATFGGIKS